MGEFASTGETGLRRLQFPSHHPGNWMTFSRKKYGKPTIDSATTLTDSPGSSTVVLPVPNQLSKSSAADWNSNDFGITGNSLYNNLGSQAEKFQRDYRQGGVTGAIRSQVDSLIASGAKADGKSNLAQAAGAGATLAVEAAKVVGTDALANSDTFRKLGRDTGLAANPYKAVLYTAPNFRNFSFSYKLIAASYEEAIAIRSIIREFQIGKSPSLEEVYENNIFSYPDIFILNLEKKEFLFQIAPCVLRQLTVDYHAEGSPTYFHRGEERIPASVNLNLDFQETVILTREQYEQGY